MSSQIIYNNYFPGMSGTVGPGGAMLERNASMDNVLDTSKTAKHDHNEYKKIKEVRITLVIVARNYF